MMKRTTVYKVFGSMLFTAFFVVSCKKDSEEIAPPSNIRPITSSSNRYVTQLLEYNPAPGQFINTAAGDSSGALTVLRTKGGFVSLGAWGGYIVLGFDHTVLNKPDTADIMIYGNALGEFAEPGIVWVMADDNGNGKADDQWYELAGSEYNKTGYERNYSITYLRPDTAGNVSWTDNHGNTGVVQTNPVHTQHYYPDWISANQYTLTGSLLPTTNIDSSNPAYVTSASFDYGYADNSFNGNMVDIDDAIDNNGGSVKLEGIDFIKVQTGIQFNMGWVGELSTEVAGIADVSMGLE